jgi:hypothetical protein
MFKHPICTQEEITKLIRHYSKDHLFVAISPVLSHLQIQTNELHPVILWHEVELLRVSLIRSESATYEVNFATQYLLGRMSFYIDIDGKTLVKRTEEQALRSTLCILLLLFLQLADGTPSEERIKDNPNLALTNAVAKIITDPKFSWYIEPMTKNLLSRKTDNLGEKMVLPVVNYMTLQASIDAMDDCSKKAIEELVGYTMELSTQLIQYLSITTEQYQLIWQNLCSDPLLMPRFSEKNPNRYPKNYNFKLFCNILGILQHTDYKENTVLDSNIKKINNALGNKNYRPYLTYYSTFNVSECAISKEEFARIKSIINNSLSEDH